METGKFIAILAGILCLFLIVPLHVSPSHSIEGQFERFVSDFNRPYRYHPENYESRFLVFEKSMVRLRTMNDTHNAKYGVTNFTDLTTEEFRRHHLGYRSQNRQNQCPIAEKDPNFNPEDLPKSIDWRSMNYVTGVKNQGTCGACWAYSVLGVIETMVAKRDNARAQDLSIQQIFDCFDSEYFGCQGGDFVELLQWIIDEKVALQGHSHYHQKPLHNCSVNNGVRVKDFKCRNFVDNEDEILNLLAFHGPLVAAINGLTWQNYLGGIIQYHCDGDLTHLNHVVEIVGYNLTHAIPHYIVRNSWGRNFGESGYVRIAIGKNLCGITQRVVAIDIEE